MLLPLTLLQFKKKQPHWDKEQIGQYWEVQAEITRFNVAEEAHKMTQPQVEDKLTHKDVVGPACITPNHNTTLPKTPQFSSQTLL